MQLNSISIQGCEEHRKEIRGSLVNSEADADCRSLHFWIGTQAEHQKHKDILQISQFPLAFQELHQTFYPPHDYPHYDLANGKHISHTPELSSNYFRKACNVWGQPSHLLVETRTNFNAKCQKGNFTAKKKQRSIKTQSRTLSASDFPELRQTQKICKANDSIYDQANSISEKQNINIIRRPTNIMVCGTNIAYGAQPQNQEFFNIDLRIVGAALEEIIVNPWDEVEGIEGRRMIRIERSQQGCILQAHFRVIQSPQSSNQRRLDCQTAWMYHV